MTWAEWRSLLDTYLRPRARTVAVLGLALFATIGLQIATPQVVRLFIDRATSPTGGSLAWVTVAYVGAVLLQQGFRVVTAWLSQVVGWLTTNDLRADLMAHCLRLDPGFHETHPPGELIERVDGDLNGLSTFFAEFLLSVVGNLLLLAGVLAVVWFQSPVAGSALTVFAAVAVVAMLLVRRVAAASWQRSREATAAVFGFVEERLAGTEDIRSSAAEAHTLRGLYARTRDRTWSLRRARVMDTIPGVVNNWVAAGASVLAFLLPVVLTRDGTLTVGGAFVLYFYAQLLLQPLGNMSRQVEALQQAIAGGRRVLELLATRPSMVDGPGAEVANGALEVRLRSVSFGYGTDPDVLHDLSIDVPAGTVLGIVGRTGSGKSSIARLLVRLHDVRRGAIEIGGADVRQLTWSQLRKRVSLVTQEVHVLRATV
jgi:ABC-type multidrug transport system fused ATPase/permease subunit